MTAHTVLETLTSWWFILAIVLVCATVSLGVIWFRRQPPEQAHEAMRQMREDPEFGTRREPIHEGLFSSYRAGQWRAHQAMLTARWQGDEPRYREQTGTLKVEGDPPPQNQERDVLLLDGGEWVRTHLQEPGGSGPHEPGPHLVTRTRDSRLPVDLRWNKRGPNPVQFPGSGAQGDQARQLLLDADRRLRRVTVLWRWGYRAAMTGLVLSVLLIPLGAAVHSEFFVVALLGIVLLLPVSVLLRWARIIALRRRGRRMLAGQSEERRAAAWVNREVLAQWRAGGHDFWEYAPALPPAMAWSWRKDPRWPITMLLALLGLLGVIFAGITLVQVMDWVGGAAEFPVAMVITTAFFLGLAAVAGWLSKRPDHDYAQFGQLMHELRHSESMPGPHQVSPWPAPQDGQPLLNERREDVHEQVSELYPLSRPWRRRRSGEPGPARPADTGRPPGAGPAS